MAAGVAEDLRDFRDFVSRLLDRDGRVPTPEECVQLWREWCETNEAIREGLDQADRGLGQPLEEFLAEFRRAVEAKAWPVEA